MCQCALQGTLPTFFAVVQVGTSSSQFAGWVHLHTIGCAYQADHFPFGQHFPTTHTSPLGHMFHTLNRFLRHLHLKPLPRLPHLRSHSISLWGQASAGLLKQRQSLYYHSSSSESPRLCFLRPTTSPRSSSSTSSTLFFLPFLPFFLSADSSSSPAGVWKISGFMEKRSSSETPSLACSSSSCASRSRVFFESFLAAVCASSTGTTSATSAATASTSG